MSQPELVSMPLRDYQDKREEPRGGELARADAAALGKVGPS